MICFKFKTTVMKTGIRARVQKETGLIACFICLLWPLFVFKADDTRKRPYSLHKKIASLAEWNKQVHRWWGGVAPFADPLHRNEAGTSKGQARDRE